MNAQEIERERRDNDQRIHDTGFDRATVATNLARRLLENDITIRLNDIVNDS